MAGSLTILSFAYSKGAPEDADLIHDMRFLRNPHWQEGLRERDGRDPAVGAYIAGDAAYAEAVARIEAQLLDLLPRRATEENRCLSVAFGCTGGRHRSVHIAERVAARLRAAGFSPNLVHRDLAAPPADGNERSAGAGLTAFRVDE